MYVCINYNRDVINTCVKYQSVDCDERKPRVHLKKNPQRRRPCRRPQYSHFEGGKVSFCSRLILKQLDGYEPVISITLWIMIVYCCYCCIEICFLPTCLPKY